MKPEIWWKNFGLNLELDASGMFIYNGIKALDSIEGLGHPIDIFEVLYNLSVGIERLLKITIILLEHDEQMELEEFEKSLITHNSMELANRIDDQRDLNLSKIHREFLSIISKFYKSHRYGRYTMASVPNIDEEKRLFLKFIGKHLSIDTSIDDSLFAIPNTPQVKKFIGRIVAKISQSLYSVICDRAREINIYTYEIRSDSKAMKVFHGDRLDFIDEDLTRRELLLYLMHPTSDDEHIELIRSFDPLPLDPGLTPSYAKAVLKDTPSSLMYVSGEVEELYSEVSDIGERFEILELIDNEYLNPRDNSCK